MYLKDLSEKNEISSLRLIDKAQKLLNTITKYTSSKTKLAMQNAKQIKLKDEINAQIEDNENKEEENRGRLKSIFRKGVQKLQMISSLMEDPKQQDVLRTGDSSNAALDLSLTFDSANNP